MNDYIAKPIDPESMYATIARWLPFSATASATAAPTAPPRTLSDVASSSVSDRKPDNDNVIIQVLKQIPDLDVDLGLARMLGRVDLYLKLVRRVVAERADLPQQLAAALESKDNAEAIRLVHGLRAVAGMLGATLLQGLSAELEQQVDQRSLQAEMLETFEFRFEALLEGLRASLLAEDEMQHIQSLAAGNELKS